MLRRQHHSQGFHGLIEEGLELALVQSLDVAVDGGARIQTLAIPDQHILELLQVLEFGKRGGGVHLVTPADQSSSTRVGEQLLLQIGRVDDGNTRGTRQLTEELLHFLDLEASAVAHPPLLHQVVVFFIKVDDRDLLSRVTVEQTTLLSQVDDLERLQRARQLTSRNIRIDVEHLTIGGLGHRGQNGETSSLNGRLNGLPVNPIDLSHQVVLFLVQVIGREHTGIDRTGSHTHPFQLLSQLHVLLQEQLPGQSQRLAICYPNSTLELRFHTCILQHTVQLGARTVDDNGIQPNMVQEGQGGRQRLQMIGNDSTSNLDHGKLLRGHGGEVGEVLLDFALGTDVTQELHNGGAGRGQLRISGP